MIYEMKVGLFDPDRPAGDRWFANQIEGRFGQFGDAALPLDWVLLLRELDKERNDQGNG